MYNVENYLGKCLDSVLNQTLKDIEIICVDDGSPDRSGAIAEEYAKKYENIKVLRKENGGLSSARNAGMEAATGRYLYFLDSDDFLEPDALQSLCRKADTENLDIVYFNTHLLFESAHVRELNRNYVNYYTRRHDYPDILTGQSMFAQMRKNREFFPSVCLQFFRRSLIRDNGLRFYDGIIHEDNLFSFQCMILAQRVGYDYNVYYHRRMHGNSIMTAGKSIRNVEGYLVTYAEILAFMHGRKVEEEAFEQISEFLYTSVWGNGRRIFQELDIPEENATLTKGDFCAAHMLDMVKRGGETEFDRSRLKEQNSQLRQQLQRLDKVTRYSLLRRVGTAIQCVEEHGFRYTVTRAFYKVGGKLSRSQSHPLLPNMPQEKLYGLMESQDISGPPLISFILPVYNCEEFLEQCIGSLRTQTMKRIEIIAVDDGSTDSSVEILKRLATEDRRVRVFTQRNQYAGAARNLGLSYARGEYVIFLDSDDFFAETLAKDTYVAAREHSADIVLFGAKHYHHKAKEFREARWLLNAGLAPKNQPFSYKDCPDDLYRITTPCPWTKMFRRKFILDTGLQFQRIQNANDLFFVYSALAMAERIITVDKPLVYYRVGLETNLQSTKKKHPFCFAEAYQAWHDKLAALGVLDTLRRSYANRALSGCLHNLRSQKDSEAKKAVFDILHNEILQKLELLCHEESYYYNKADYEEMLLIINSTFEQYLTNRNIGTTPPSAAEEAHLLSPAISVIIPCYNAEKYLDLCMRTVLNQTLRDLEIICIDDGSTDHTLEILNRYAEKDKRVRIFSQQNQFAGAARNLGLANARGEYVLFLDSDDFFEESLAQDAYSMANANNADVVLYDARYFDETTSSFRGGWFLNTTVLPENQPFSYKDCPDDLYQITTACPWTKLFRRQFLLDTGLQFQTLRHSNDIFFTLSALAMAKHIVTLDKKLVNYRVGHATNLQSTKDKNPLCFYTAYQAWHDKLDKLGLLQVLQRSYVNRALDGCLYNLRSLKDPEAKKIVVDKLLSEIFQKLELSGYDASYYYKDSDYNEYLLLTTSTFAQYLAIPESAQLRNLWHAVQTGTRKVCTLPCGSKPRNAALSMAAEQIISIMKRCISSFSHPDAQQAYQMVHEAFNREEFSDANLLTFPDRTLYQAFATIQKHDYATMKDLISRRLVVSMTSYPGRIRMLMPVLESLYAQSRKADEILLWLAEEQFPGKEADLPRELVQLASANRLTIRWCDDLKPHKKYFYALQEYPEDIIVTVDDDLLYSENLLSSLYASYLLHPHAVSAVRAHLMLISPKNELLPYNTWIRETDSCIHTPSMQLFATGGAGALYPPHLFRQEFFDRDAIISHCLLADDLWLKAMELVSGVPVVVAREREPLQYVPKSQVDALKRINDVQQHNDVQLANIIRWTDEVFGKDVLIRVLSDTGIHQPILGVESVAHHLDQERRALWEQLHIAQARQAESEAKQKQAELRQKQAENRQKQAETRLATTKLLLQEAIESQPVGRQLRTLGAPLFGKKKSPIVLFKRLVYYSAWIPEKILALQMYYLQNGFKYTLKHFIDRLLRKDHH